ncbi:MAG: hypothetical protein ACK55I_48360 [bacterium]|jgi:hypothetical protein
MTNYGRDDFIYHLTTQVANEFGLDQATLDLVYFTGYPYNFDSSCITFLKYASSSGVSDTPTAFVSGVMLDSVPRIVNSWIMTFKQVYQSQYK